MIDQLVQALNLPLPGVEAQLQLAHPARSLEVPPGVDAREAAVIILLFEREGSLHFPLIQRTSHNIRDQHRGQISLPGGKRELSDNSLIDTALREAQEEVGVNLRKVEVLGQLSQLYIPVSNFTVLPTVAIVSEIPQWRAQESEVVHIFETSVERLHEEDVVKQTDISLHDRLRLKSVPYFDLNGRIVWGATAMILSEFRQVLAKAKL